MLEFLLSKLWMFIAGTAAIAVVLAAFGGLNGSLAEEGTRSAVEDVSGTLAELGSCPVGTTVRLAPDLAPGTVIRVGSGAVWLVRDGGDLMVTGPTVVPRQDGHPAAYVEAGPDDTIVAQRLLVDGKTVTVVQVEKAAASSSTAATNRLASSSVLYR